MDYNMTRYKIWSVMESDGIMDGRGRSIPLANFISCSTVVGSFFLKFVRISNNFSKNLVLGAKTCRHTNCNLYIYIALYTCFLYRHVCAHNKTKEQGWV